MISFAESEIQALALHFVGNKYHEEQVITSKNLLDKDLEIEQSLLHLFLHHFKEAECFEFYHEEGLASHHIWNSAKQIFEDNEVLLRESQSLAKHLYTISEHPKIKGGEFYVVLFNQCFIHGESVQALGLFKTEHRDTFIKIDEGDQGFLLNRQEGIHIDKLDKGCLIYNQNQKDGFRVSVVDRTNKSEARFWIDDFLQIKQEKDAFFHTEKAVELCHSFIEEELPLHYDTSKADQVDLLNRSSNFLKEQEHFNLQEFAQEVIAQPEVIDTFHAYTENFERQNDVQFQDEFDISKAAVKKNGRYLRSVIKLDKNFHIYVHGNREKIVQGVDENGQKFYTLYYDEEH
jgi:hypothetical protein